MLAGDANAHLVAIEGVQCGQVLQQYPFHLDQARRRQQFSGRQVMRDLAKDPGSPLGRSTDQQGIDAGGIEDLSGFLWRIDIAIGEDRNGHRLLDRRDGVVLGFAGVQVGAGPAVDGQGLDTGLFGDLRHSDAVPVRSVPTGADLQGNRHVNGLDHGVEDLGHQGLILHQRGACGLVADLLRRAAHVDIDDLGTEFDIGPGRFRQHLRITTGYLDGAGLRIPLVEQAQPRFAAVPQAHVAGDHFRYHHAGTEAAAEQTKRSVGHTRHGGEYHRIGQGIRANA
ncbi:hypothetical protein D3C78_316010 [compost metagenome]